MTCAPIIPFQRGAFTAARRAVCVCNLVARLRFTGAGLRFTGAGLRRLACAFFTRGKEGCALPLLVHPTVGGGMARIVCPPVSSLLADAGGAKPARICRRPAGSLLLAGGIA